MNLRTAAVVAVAGLAVAVPFARAQDSHAGHSHPHPAQPAQPVPGANIPADAPKISFDKNSHDFGVITDENKVTTVFKFTNTGKTTLKIGTVSGSCGCTVPALADKEYEPGEGGEISVTYDPHNRRGKQQTMVTVQSNDPATPSVQLAVHSDIRPMMYLDPAAATFYNAPKGKEQKSTIKIYSRKGELAPTQATASNPNVKAEIKTDQIKEEMVGDEKLFVIPMEVTLLPTAEVGNIVGQVTVRTSDPARFLNLGVSGEVVGDFNVMPRIVQMFNVPPGSPVNSSVRVTSRAGKPFKIVSAEEAALGTKIFNEITFAEVPGSNPQTWTITLAGTAPSVQSGFRGDIVVNVEGAEEKSFKIPYNGFANVPQQAPAQKFNNPTGAPVDPWAANPSSLYR
ncbi:MAG TPA: DUF1573 domain-containing protein [Phycisphaerales bacterium]|nr:DUF1573 domain-containing protein [Phycisphaerales bacterium]